jgi:anti-sigma factor RsiW
MNAITPDPEPTTLEPVPARDGHGTQSRLRLLATSAAVAGLTVTGGLAVVLSIVATGGSGAAVMTPATTAAPTDAQNGTLVQPEGGGSGSGPIGQPPEAGQGTGSGHASSWGS